jgi:hypothetical protein
MKKMFVTAMLPLTLGGGLDFQGRAFDPRLDNPSQLAPRESVSRSMREIGRVQSFMLPEVPWSDRAWDHNRALMNERYTDADFTRLGSWDARKAYGAAYSAERFLSLPPGPQRDQAISSLSPAEKYDLVMGTLRGGLTDANRKSLDREMPGSGKFPTWWGICEGSAAASLAALEPVNVISVYSVPYGVDVPFYAPDVKSLVSLLWSSYNARLKLPEIGQQCDNRGGGACADVNPASFHASIHHFLGLGKGHLIADVDESRVVWNHPLIGYETTYYRADQSPSRPAANFEEALLRNNPSLQDPRRRLRAPGTAYLLGVETKLYYADNQKQHPLSGSVKRKVLSMRLQYELELDANLNLLGGEWLTKKHPDILWTIPGGTRPDTPGDASLGMATWDGRETPSGWENAARNSAQRMMPLRKVVDGLLRRSAQP